MQLPTEFGVGAGEVPRGERGEKGEFAREGTDGDASGEGVGVGAGGSPPPLTPRISRPPGLRRSFVPPPTVPTSREAMETET